MGILKVIFNGITQMDVTQDTVARNTPPTLGTGEFSNPYSEDHSILNAYQTATNWSAFASHIQEEPA